MAINQEEQAGGRLQIWGWGKAAGQIMSSVVDMVALVCPWGIQIKMLSRAWRLIRGIVELVRRIRSFTVHRDDSSSP